MSNSAAELAGWLLKRRTPEGGFVAVAGVAANTESTALAGIVFGADGEHGRAALRWLLARQRPDGAFPLTDEVPEASWASAWALLALASDPARRDALERGARWLVEREGARPSWFARALGALTGQRRRLEQDLSLRGWPWHDAAASWAEPTAGALLALRRIAPLVEVPGARARIEEGERLLWDRMCEDGGWNYGNRRVLGEALEPFPDTTALVLMALQGSTRHELVERCFAALSRLLGGRASTLSLALGALAAELHGRDATPLHERLSQRIARRGPPEETRALAFAWLALAGGAARLGVAS